MVDPTRDPADGGNAPGPVIRDRRRLDPQTGQVREAYGSPTPGTHPAPSADSDAGPVEPPVNVPVEGTGDAIIEPMTNEPAAPAGSGGSGGPGGPAAAESPTLDGILADLDAAQSSAAERLSDLQRLQAEFINYRRRVDRDRDVAKDSAINSVLEALLPVLDDLHLARQHGDLQGGPFAAISEKLETVLQRLGLQRYGDVGEEFDPSVHEALMHTEAELAEGTTTTTVVQVLQPGYRAGDRVLRAARVAVADPH